MAHVEVRHPTRISQLVLNGLYHVTGSAEDLDMIPTQLFRLERLDALISSGSAVLYGTLWWKMWLNGRWFSGTYKNHQLLGHNVGLGAGLSGKHDLHLEAVEPSRVSDVLGKGRIYEDYIQQTRIDEVPSGRSDQVLIHV